METFFPVHVLNNHILWGEKKNNIKSHNFVFQLQTFFLNVFFFQSKEKGKGEVPQDTTHPPSSPLTKQTALKVMGFFFSTTHSALAEG